MNEPEAVCAGVREQFALLLYGELNFDEEERMESHLDACAECRELLRWQKHLHSAADMASAAPPPALLTSCRENLSAALTRAESTQAPRWWAQFAASFRGAGWRPAWGPVSAFAMLAVGFLGAQFMPILRPGGGFDSMNAADIGGSRVRNVSAGQDGRVEIVLDETRQRTVRGTLHDDSIHGLLLAASKEAPDPALRADSMAILMGGVGSADVRNALMFALEHDQNEGVRAKAMDGLKPYASDRGVQIAVAQVLLRDANRGMRTRAIDLLAAREQRELDREIVGALQELMDREEDAYVRNRGLGVLRAVKASAGIY